MKKCKYNKTCKYYNINSFICNISYKPLKYCSIFNQNESKR